MTTLKRKTATGFENIGLGGINRPVVTLDGKPLKWDETNNVVADATPDLNADYASIAGPFAPSITGATSATRYVGGTATSPPTTGTFVVGDYVVTQAGSIYVCIAAGTPGTWVRTGAGFILGSATYTSATDPTAITADNAFHNVDASLAFTIPPDVPFALKMEGLFTAQRGATAAQYAAAIFQTQVVDVATGAVIFGTWQYRFEIASTTASSTNRYTATVSSEDEHAALGSATPVQLQAKATPSGLTAPGLTTLSAAKPIAIKAIAR
jgi:hypothetical protein